jgi:photosystem II stability/assembly factor-like uncharacterized protein
VALGARVGPKATSIKGVTMRRMSWLLLAVLPLLLVTALPAAASSSFSFVDARHGWYVGGLDAHARLWKTSDGGKTLKLLPARFIGAGGGGAWVDFISPKVGIWWGEFGELGVAASSMQRTTDGGAHWSRVTWTSLAVAHGLAFADATHGWASSANNPPNPAEGGEIARTSDGGATWITVRVLESGYFYDLASPSPQYCYAFGSGAQSGLWVTANGGGSWTQRALPGGNLDSYRWAMAFPAKRTGWLAGADGAIFKTTDGGASWARQVSGARRSLYDLEFVDIRYGWAVGERGTILATRDGGAHWHRQSPGTKAGLGEVDFVDRLHGWAGDRALRLRTTDGGKTWTKL